MNNTSISFLLPSEFKTLWENLSKNMLLEAFDCLYDDYINLSHVTHDLFLITYDETKGLIREKINSVLKILKINTDLKDKNSSNPEEKFALLFKSFFQDYFSQIFEFTKDLNDKIKQKLSDKVKEYANIENKENKNIDDIFDDFVLELNKIPFKNLTENLFKLCAYMLLHDPILTFDIPPHKERKLNYMFYNKNNLLNIEGFGNDETPCVVIVPPPLINSKHVYLGIKPAVYCIQKNLVTKEILEECEKNKNINSTHKHSSSNIELSQLLNHTHNEILGDNRITVTPSKNTTSKLVQPTLMKYGSENSNNSIVTVTKQKIPVSTKDNLSKTENENQAKNNEPNVKVGKEKSLEDEMLKLDKSKFQFNVNKY
jgi:hypothetical protein